MNRTRSQLFSAALALAVFGVCLYLQGCSRPVETAGTTDIITYADPQPREADVDGLDVHSPFEIEKFINLNPRLRIETLWAKLGIAGAFHGLAAGTGPPLRGGFFVECQYCEAETFNHDLDGQPGEEVLLRVDDSLSGTSRYLVFKGDEPDAGYRLIGHIDHNFGKYKMPDHKFAASRGRDYLLASAQTQSGSGVARYVDRLFTVSGGQLEELVTFPAEGHQHGSYPYPDRRFSGKLLEVATENDSTRVSIQLIVEYTLPDELGGDLASWTKVQKAVYVKRAGAGRAVLDARRSDLTQAELNAVYDIDSLSDEDLIKYNRKELRAAGWRPPSS